MRINNNLMAMNTHRQLGAANAGGAKSMEKLSSGMRINRAGDDAAGLAISEKMRGQIRGLNQASSNAQDGISMIQTAEGALNETHAILQRMRELAVQSATDTNTNADRGEIQKEVDELAKEITRISNTTEFNTQNLMAGGLDNTFHVGANQGQNVGLKVGAMDAFALGIATGAKSGAVDSTANTGKLTAISNVGEGLTEEAYSVIITKTAASNTVAVQTGTGAAEATITGDYTGKESTTDANSIQVKVASVTGTDDAARITGVVISKDGGATWSGEQTIANQGEIDLGDGLKMTFDDEKGVVDDVYKFGATASTTEIQLANAAGDTTIGEKVLVRNDASEAIIGKADEYKSVTVSFSYATLTTSAGAATKFSVATDSSRSATFKNDGTIDLEAKAAAGINVSTQDKADTAIGTINKAIESVSSERSKLGAMQNRLEHTIKNLDTSAENLQASEARIRDVDMAKEMMEQTKQNILAQASTAMLANANQAPQAVLQLLR